MERDMQLIPLADRAIFCAYHCKHIVAVATGRLDLYGNHWQVDGR